MTDIAPGKRKLDLGRVFGDTLNVVRRQAPLLLGVTFVLYFLPTVASSFIRLNAMRGLGSSPANPLALFATPTYWIMLGVAVLLGTLTLACQLQIAISDLEGKSPTLREVLQLGLRKCLPLLASMVLLALGLWLAMLFLLIPGIILGLMWAVTAPAVVGETSHVFRAFGRSRALTRGNRWRILGLIVIVLLILIVVEGLFVGALRGFKSLTAGGAISILGALVFGVLSLAISVLGSVGSAALYVQLRELKGAGGERVAQVFA